MPPDEQPAPSAPDGQPTPANAPASGTRPRTAEAMPRVVLTRKRLLASGIFVVSIVAFLYFVLPKILGLHKTWHRIEHGNAWWLVAGLVLEVCSFLGYIALFRAVFLRDDEQTPGSVSADSAGGESDPDAPRRESPARIGWRESYEITMAGLAATRLFASAGAGGIALTAWALRRAGFEPRTVASRMIAFTVLVYGVFMATLVVDGLGLYLGVFPGSAPFAITVVPAIVGGSVIALFLSMSLVPGDFDRLVARATNSKRLIGRIAQRLAAVPAAAASGVRGAIELVRARDPYTLGAIGWWAFDISVLWACFHAFGGRPPTAVVVMSYFVGMVGNTLPLPGGIGGVDGGMIGAFTAFGVPVETSVVAVLAYRGIAFWLPTLPGGFAYLQLRRTVHRWEQSHAAAGSASEPAVAVGGGGAGGRPI